VRSRPADGAGRVLEQRLALGRVHFPELVARLLIEKLRVEPRVTAFANNSSEVVDAAGMMESNGDWALRTSSVISSVILLSEMLTPESSMSSDSPAIPDARFIGETPFIRRFARIVSQPALVLLLDPT
jgi:hypothetical protein